jgi:hypothetical protein
VDLPFKLKEKRTDSRSRGGEAGSTKHRKEKLLRFANMGCTASPVSQSLHPDEDVGLDATNILHRSNLVHF